MLSEPVVPLPPPVSATPKPKVAGVSSRVLYSTELQDIDKLIDAAAATPKGSVERQLLAYNQRAADQLAKATKGQVNFPGVKVVTRRSVSATAG